MIIIGSDHAGVELKNKIIEYLAKKHIDTVDVVENNDMQDDYPDIALKICENVLKDNSNMGIAICGTGIGISIACNKVKGIRAALCTDAYMAEMCRKHNNANILCLGAKLKIFNDNIESIVQAFLDNFYEAGRHERRILKIENIEKLNTKDGI